MYTAIGNANLKLKKNDAAIAAYNKAASLEPQSGRCLFQSLRDHVQHGPAGGEDRSACDKAIAADPKKADAYFIKGSSLFGEGALDKSNKFVVPPGGWKR